MKQQIRFCTSRDGVRLAYAATGQGPALVKAANWLTHLEHDLHSPLWRPFLERLSRRHRLIRYDQRGSGLSDWNVADISFETWVDDFEAVIEASGLQRFALLGISQGGPVAVAYAVRHPQKVSHLVLYGAFARGALRREQTKQAIDEARALVELVRLGWGKQTPSFRHVFALQFLPHGSAEQLRYFDELQRVSASPENAARIIAAFDSIDVTTLAPKVRAPTLVLHSRGDARVPFDEGRLLATLIPNARFVPVNSRSHVPLSDDAAFSPMLAAIEEFLATDSPTGQPAAYADLTPRERDILDLLAQGLNNAEIGRRLGIQDKTVRNHMSSIFGKLDASGRGEAIVKAREAGFGNRAARD